MPESASQPGLRYPIGPFQSPEHITAQDRVLFLRELSECPGRMREVVSGLTDAQLDTPYRPGGWTIRQVVHHVPDSHMNCYVRFKLSLTEDQPLVKPYDEGKWAQLPDSISGPPDISLRLLEALHERWVLLLQSMTDAQFARIYRHPEYLEGSMRLDTALAMYVWHCRHHVAHVRGLRERMNW